MWTAPGYAITYNPVRKLGIKKDDLLRLKLLHPEIYEEFISVTEYRTFNVRQIKAEAA